MTNNNIPKYINVLDGVRAISIVFVVWFHFWQQSWITPYIIIPSWMNTYLGINSIPFDSFVRAGFVFVDMLILLSAVCNFYPYARSILLGETWPDFKVFYKKRAIRIIPSYLLAISIMFIIALAEKRYFSFGFMVKDFLAHLFFMKPFFNDLMMYSPINGVLWTVQVEFLYYLLMPWLALLFKKRPYIMCILMICISLFSIRLFFIFFKDNVYINNNMFTYAIYYGCGMLICMIYIEVKLMNINVVYAKIIPTLVIVGCIYILNVLIHNILDSEINPIIQELQMTYRPWMAIVFSFIILSTMFIEPLGEKILTNTIFKFISTISYNLYIWHQFIAVKLKEYHIPFWQGEQSPNLLNDRIWMWKYQLTIIFMSIIVASLLTYCFEKPISKFLKKCIINRH